MEMEKERKVLGVDRLRRRAALCTDMFTVSLLYETVEGEVIINNLDCSFEVGESVLV